ncbi:MAG TPA: hypothetical protein VF644_02795 [Pyrinomonadaceae bacterium]|jgi:hypothetical protein
MQNELDNDKVNAAKPHPEYGLFADLIDETKPQTIFQSLKSKYYAAKILLDKRFKCYACLTTQELNQFGRFVCVLEISDLYFSHFAFCQICAQRYEAINDYTERRQIREACHIEFLGDMYPKEYKWLCKGVSVWCKD